MKNLEKKQRKNEDENPSSKQHPVITSPSQKDSSSSPSPSSSSSSFSNERFDRKVEKSMSSPVKIVRTYSLDTAHQSGHASSISPNNLMPGGGVLSSSTDGSHDTSSSPDATVDIESLRRTKSMVEPRKPLPPNSIKVERADNILGTHPSLHAIRHMVTQSVEDFQAHTPSLSDFKDSGLFTTLKWKLRLALAKLPGSCLPLNPNLAIGGENQPPVACNKDSKSAKGVLLWMLYKSTSSVEWFNGPSMVNATVDVLFVDIYRWMVTLPEE